jgi:hypothetical protein
MDGQRDVAICCNLCGGRPQCTALCHSSSLSLANSDTEGEEDRLDRLVRVIHNRVGGAV